MYSLNGHFRVYISAASWYFHAGKLLNGTKTFSLTLHCRTNEPLLEYCCKLRQAHLSHLSVAVSINYTQLNTVHMSRIHLAKVNTISCPSGHPNFKMTIEKTIWLLAGLDCGSLYINRMTVMLQIFLPYCYSGIPDCSTHAFIAERYLLSLLDVCASLWCKLRQKCITMYGYILVNVSFFVGCIWC